MIISDFKTTGYWNEITLLARKHDVIALRISDPTDHAYPKSGMVELVDPESGGMIVGEGPVKVFRRRYESYWDKHYLDWRTGCARRGIEILEISTSDDPGVKLMEFFQRRKKRWG